MKIYCPSCGQPNLYSDVRPKFCGFCQSALSVVVANDAPSAPVRKPIPPKFRRPIDDDDDDEHVSLGSDLSQMDGIDIEFELRPDSRQKLRDICWTGAVGINRDPQPVHKKKGRKPKLDVKKEATEFAKKIFQTAKGRNVELND